MRITERNLEVIRAAPIVEIVRSYGLEPNRAGFIRCPFHNEKTPSMKLYAEENRWHCFGGCHKGGDSIAFVQEMESLDFLAAAERVNRICGLGLNLGQKETLDERKKREKRQEQRDILARFNAWESAFYQRLANCIYIGNHALAIGPPWTAQEEEAIRRMAGLEYIADVLNGDDDEEKIDIFRRRAEYEAIFRAIEGDENHAQE